MTPIKLKEEAQERVIAFNNSSAPLGQREDLDKFLRIAFEADRQDYLDLFESHPTRDELLVEELEAKLADIDFDALATTVLPPLPSLDAVGEVEVNSIGSASLSGEELALKEAQEDALRAQALADTAEPPLDTSAIAPDAPAVENAQLPAPPAEVKATTKKK